MAEIVSQFFLISGLNEVAPETLADLIPWLVKVFVAVALVSGVFRVIGKLAEIFVNYRRW